MSREGRDWAAAQTTGDFTLKAVLDKLGHLADPRGLVYHGQTTIAALMECDRKTISRALKRLEAMRLIRREPRLRKDGSRTTDHIWLKRTSDAEDLAIPEEGRKVTAGGQSVRRVGTESREGGDRQSPLTTFESDSESESDSGSPQPPDGGDVSRSKPDREGSEAGQRFAQLLAVYPPGGLLDANRGEAERKFRGLTPADQELAVRVAAIYAAHVRQRQGQGAKRLHIWLDQERFRNVSPAAPAAPRTDLVFLREDTPEWDAWERFERAHGRVPKLARWSETHRASGWWFASALPPSVPQPL